VSDVPDAAASALLTEDRQRALQRRVLIALSVAQVAGGLGIGAGVSVGALLALELSGSAAASGLAATGATLGAAVVAVPLARLAVARGRRVALSTGWLVAAAGAALTVTAAVVRSFPLFMLATGLVGSGTAANLQSRFAATDLASPATRARSLSLVVWATTIGAVAGPNLTRPGAVLAGAVGIPALAGPMLISSAAALGAAGVLLAALRPDPLLAARRLDPLLARRLDRDGPGPRAVPRQDAGSARTETDVAGRPSALAVVAASPVAVAALAALVTGHGVMVAVMSMTPVHMDGQGAGLTVIGFTISLHIAGMYAFSPLAGWVADRRGRPAAILAGQGLLVAATVVTATAGRSTPRIMMGLLAIGLGWSFSTIGASALLAEVVAPADRPRVQGTADLCMNLAGALGGAAAGLLVSIIGYDGLSGVAALAVAPALCLVVLTRRHVRASDHRAALAGVGQG
jgi:MFS family permease